MLVYIWKMIDGSYFKEIGPTGRYIIVKQPHQAHMFTGEDLQDLRGMWEQRGGEVLPLKVGAEA